MTMRKNICLLGCLVFARYHERKVLARINEELAEEGIAQA